MPSAGWAQATPGAGQTTTQAPAPSGGVMLQEVIVTAQRRAEPLQSVPIAVTAFTGAALEQHQIHDVTDLQFNTPNLSFTQGPFGGNNLQVRGIGTLLVNGEAGVGVHYNDVFIASPRLTETEYYDLADIEVLRGPQGTLFGRNSTGGVLNVKTQLPLMNRFESSGEFEYGNFNDKKLRAAINVPLIEDKLSARVAGLYLDRDGYTKNINTGNQIDGRTQYSVRGSLLFTPTPDTTVTLVGSYFNENSSRLRFQKQLCERDPSGVLGCLPNGLATQPTNSISSGAGLTSNVFTGAALGNPGLGLIDFFNPPISANPSSLREVNQAFDPRYKTDETFVMAQLQQKLTRNLDLTVLAGYQDYGLDSSSDFQSAVFAPLTLPAAFFTYKPGAAAFLHLTPGSAAPTSGLGPCGIACGDLQTSKGSGLQDDATGGGHQESVEARITSHFDGPFNFLVAGYYLNYKYRTGLQVVEPFLDYAAMLLAGPDPSASTFKSLAPSRFGSFAPQNYLTSYAFFGEGYYDIVPDLVKLTIGVRHTQDEKRSISRQALFSVPVVTDVATGKTSFTAPNGTVTTSNDENVLLNVAAAAGVIDFDPSRPGSQAYADQHLTAGAWTGRAVIDYTPHLSFTNQTLVYASYSRGSKAGGFNPPADPLLNLGAPPTYAPESVDAFEIGTKNLLLDRRLKVNLTGFYYNYSGLQIGTINNRTSYTTNVDTTIYGAEGEFAFAVTKQLQLDASVAYLHTELGDATSIDPRNPSQSRADADLIKDLLSNGNCVVLDNGNPSIENNPSVLAALNTGGGFYLPTGPAGIPYLPAGAPAGGIPTTPGIAHSAFGSCSGLASSKVLANAGYTVFASGLPVSLKGNKLPNSPEWSLSLGAQYTADLHNDMSPVSRLDYTWRDDFFGTQYNAPRDRISGYDQLNLSMTLFGPRGRWYVRGFVQNLTDNDNIIGLYNSDPGAGLYTNAFLAAPRLFGVALEFKY